MNRSFSSEQWPPAARNIFFYLTRNIFILIQNFKLGLTFQCLFDLVRLELGSDFLFLGGWKRVIFTPWRTSVWFKLSSFTRFKFDCFIQLHILCILTKHSFCYMMAVVLIYQIFVILRTHTYYVSGTRRMAMLTSNFNLRKPLINYSQSWNLNLSIFMPSNSSL